MASCNTHRGLRKDGEKAKRDRPKEDCYTIPVITTQGTLYIGKDFAMTALEFHLYSISKSGFLTHRKNVSQL